MLWRLAFASMAIVTVRLPASAALDQQRSAAAARTQPCAVARAFPNILPHLFATGAGLPGALQQGNGEGPVALYFPLSARANSQDQAAGGGSAGGSRCLVCETADMTPMPMITSAPTMI